jgi:transcriptional regulator with XRE-family HTH domain
MSLRELRHNTGLSANEALARLREIVPTAPQSRNGLLKIEARGTRNVVILRALASIYGVSLEEVEAAAAIPATPPAKSGGMIAA